MQKGYDSHNSTDLSPLFAGVLPKELPRSEVVPLGVHDTDSVLYLLRGHIVEQTSDRFNGITTYAVYGSKDMVIIRTAKLGKVSVPVYRALTESSYLILPAATFFEHARQSQQYANALTGKLLYQLRLAHDRTANLSLKYATDRVVYRLLFFAERFGIRKGPVVEIRLPLTHQLLASSVNLSRERVSQIMHKLAQAGYVTYTRKRISLQDLPALERLLTPSDRLN